MFCWIPSLAGHEDGKERHSWSRLHNQISQKRTTLKKVQEEHQTLISAKDGETPKKVRKYNK